MGWSRKQNPSDNEPDPNNSDPLADNMRHRRRNVGGTQPLDNEPTASIYDQRTVVDTNFTNRGQARRQRQGATPFSTQQLGAWAADPANTRILIIAGSTILGFLLLLALISFYNRNSGLTPNDTGVFGASAAASASAPGFDIGAPAASTGADVGVVPQPVETIPGSDPAQQPPAASTGQFFVVTGTGAEGLFLRPEPSTGQPAIGTLPEGTRVEYTGEAQNDGTREWRKVRSDFGEGWVASDFLQPAP